MTKHSTRTARLVPLALFFLLIAFVSKSQEIPSDEAAISAGEKLFKNNCYACHEVHKKKVGPALQNVYNRAPSIDWIKSFVRNSAAVIASGDEYANNLFSEFNQTPMQLFTSLKDEEIMSIMAYIKSETDKGPPEAASQGPAVAGNEGTGGGIPSEYLNAILIGMVLILLLLVIILGFLISAIKRFLDQRDLSEEEREVIHSPITTGSVMRSRGFIFLVVFIVAAVGFKAVISGLYSIGVQQGYAPKQPIAFSHKIHAGQYGIDCQYCHTGVTKGKNANIPSPNICMNCHNQIKQGTLTGESEIAILVEKYEKNEPIEWVRVHNLPDLAYFNHAQHVNVGEIACQTCHGPIEEMDVVRQYSMLTMGWCIDCHRKTDVTTRGNEYYDKLLEYHEKYHNGEDLKVEDIGGLECARCHY